MPQVSPSLAVLVVGDVFAQQIASYMHPLPFTGKAEIIPFIERFVSQGFLVKFVFDLIKSVYGSAIIEDFLQAVQFCLDFVFNLFPVVGADGEVAAINNRLDTGLGFRAGGTSRFARGRFRRLAGGGLFRARRLYLTR